MRAVELLEEAPIELRHRRPDKRVSHDAATGLAVGCRMRSRRHSRTCGRGGTKCFVRLGRLRTQAQEPEADLNRRLRLEGRAKLLLTAEALGHLNITTFVIRNMQGLRAPVNCAKTSPPRLPQLKKLRQPVAAVRQFSAADPAQRPSRSHSSTVLERTSAPQEERAATADSPVELPSLGYSRQDTTHCCCLSQHAPLTR